MTTFEDLRGVEVEHYLGATTGLGLVKLRAIGARYRLLGELSPADARNLARDLLDAAARADYEQDAAEGLAAIGVDDRAIAAVLHAVRAGERARAEREAQA